VSHVQAFIDSLLPGNYALTKSMELTKESRCGTLWYTKKFLVLYYYVFLSDDIQTRAYIDKAVAIFDRYIDSLPEKVQGDARLFFYPENPAINLKSDLFKSFSAFAGQLEFQSAEERDAYYQNAKLCYFTLLMDSGGQRGVKKMLKVALQRPGFVYSEAAIQAELLDAAIRTAVEDCLNEGKIKDNSVKYLLSAEAMERITASAYEYTLSYEEAVVIVAEFPKASPKYRSIENDMVAFIRNERQVLYYYGYFHSKSLGATDLEFSSLTPVGELALEANAPEFLALWEHQKIKMISQPPTVTIDNLPSGFPDPARFSISFTPYRNILGHLLRQGRLDIPQYQYVTSRRSHNIPEEDWIAMEDELLSPSTFPEIQRTVHDFGRISDRNSYDSSKELKKYLMGLLDNLKLDRGTNPLGVCSYRNGTALLHDENGLSLLLQLCDRLCDYKTIRYDSLFLRCEEDLRGRYTAAINGSSRPIDRKVKIDWDLYIIRPDRFILAGILISMAALQSGVFDLDDLSRKDLPRLYSFCTETCPGLFKSLGFRSEASVKQLLSRALNSLQSQDYSPFCTAEDDRDVETSQQYYREGTSALMAKLRSLSAEACSAPIAGRVRNQQLVSLLKAYHLRRLTKDEPLRCECCGKPAFLTESGAPYVEFHHLIPFGEAYGPDHYLNLFALCPDCHRKFHALRTQERRSLYAHLNANNHLKLDLVSRLRTIKDERHLTSYHLEYLLANGAISQEDYEEIASWSPLRSAPRKRAGEVDINAIRNTVICARSDEYLAKFPSGCIDMVITSPPYDELRDYDGKVAWDFSVFTEVASQLYRVMKDGGVMVWVVGDQISGGSKSLTSYRQALFFRELGFHVYDVIIYEKLGSGPPHPNRYFNTFEYMFILSKGKPKTVNLLRDKENKWAGASTYGNVTRREKDGTLTNKGKKIIQPFGVRTNIWKYANGKGFASKDAIAYEHPAIFPEKLAADHIRSWSNEGDLILDPFAGSGTTAKMAQELGRDWIMIDAVKEYCALTEKRLKGR